MRISGSKHLTFLGKLQQKLKKSQKINFEQRAQNLDEQGDPTKIFGDGVILLLSKFPRKVLHRSGPLSMIWEFVIKVKFSKFGKNLLFSSINHVFKKKSEKNEFSKNLFRK
jgi:hypothetical protein